MENARVRCMDSSKWKSSCCGHSHEMSSQKQTMDETRLDWTIMGFIIVVLKGRFHVYMG